MISLYNSNETNFTHNGLVVLSDCMSFSTIEKLNGEYEVEFEYPLDSGGKWQHILEGNIVKNTDGQLFRIYRKMKGITGIRANCRHIFYDLLDNFLEDVRPTGQTGEGALDWVLTHTQYSHNFTSMGDVGGEDTRYFIKKNPVEAIIGEEGIIATWGGEIIRDNFNIKLLQARGLDRGVLISHGKNIIGIEETIYLDSVITRIYPTGKDGLTLAEKYVDSQYINNYPSPKIKEVQFEDIEEESALRAAAQNYFISSKCDIPIANYAVDFVELTKTEEYKNYAVLETAYLGDTVTIRHSKLNIDLKCKVISIQINDLTNRIERMELGSFKPDLVESLNRSIQSIVKNKTAQITSAYQAAINNATALITGSNGGNVVIRQDDTGKPYEILIMDTANVLTAVNVWRWNLNGFGHSSTGINGPYDTAITQDGSIMGTFITALAISCSDISGGTLTLGGTNNDLGQMYIRDGNNNLVGWIKAGSGNNSDLYVSKIRATNIIMHQEGKDIYVNSSTGNDASATRGDVSTPFKTLTAAINSLDKYLLGTVNVYAVGTFNETIEVNGFCGKGELNLYLGTSTITGNWYFIGNTIYVGVYGQDENNKASLLGEPSALNYQIYIGSCLFVNFEYVNLNNGQSNNYCIEAIHSVRVTLNKCQMTNSKYALYHATGGNHYLNNINGAFYAYGYVTVGVNTFLQYTGVCPKKWDDTQGITETHETTYRSYLMGPWTATLPEMTTTQWGAILTGTYNHDTGDWLNGDTMYQGTKDSDIYYGTMWIDNTNLRSALQGKTIRSARLYLSRYSGEGPDVPMKVVVCPISNTDKSGIVDISGQAQWEAGYWNLGESKWSTIPENYINNILVPIIAGTVFNGLALIYTVVTEDDRIAIQGTSAGAYVAKLEITYYQA